MKDESVPPSVVPHPSSIRTVDILTFEPFRKISAFLFKICCHNQPHFGVLTIEQRRRVGVG